MSIFSENLFTVTIVFPRKPVELCVVIDWLVVVKLHLSHLRIIPVTNHKEMCGMFSDLLIHVPVNKTA